MDLHTVKTRIRRTFILKIRRCWELRQWERNGKLVPSPHLIKQRTVREYAERFSLNTLIETGTYRGEMVSAMRRSFRQIFSIELDPVLFEQAQERFSSRPHITILQGDSNQILPEILTAINTPCLFWLDAHYSGGTTARGDLETPVIQELELILNHPVKTHVILIDDARCFVGQNDYPKLDTLEAMLLKSRSGWIFEVKDDIIRIHECNS